MCIRKGKQHVRASSFSPVFLYWRDAKTFVSNTWAIPLCKQHQQREEVNFAYITQCFSNLPSPPRSWSVKSGARHDRENKGLDIQEIPSHPWQAPLGCGDGATFQLAHTGRTGALQAELGEPSFQVPVRFHKIENENSPIWYRQTQTHARHQTAYGERMRKSGGTSKYETRPPFGATGCSKNIRLSAKQIPSKTGPRGFGCRWVVGLGRPHRARNVNKTLARSRYIAVCAVIFEQFNLLTNQLRLPALGRSVTLFQPRLCVCVCMWYT